MESKKNKKLFNIIMIVIILVIAAGGIFAVGSVKGWFSDKDDALAEVDSVSGIVNIERDGVSFELEKGTALGSGDKITSNEKAGVVIKAGANTYELAENSSVLLGESKDGFDMKVAAGEIFAVVNSKDDFRCLTAEDVEITSDNGIFSVNVQTGSMGINVFGGSVKALKGEKSVTAKAGEADSILGDDMELVVLNASSLNQFNIDKVISAGDNHELCFSSEELNKVVEDREKEVEQAAKDAEEDQTEQQGNTSASQGKNQGGSQSGKNPGTTSQGSSSQGGGQSSGQGGSSSGGNQGSTAAKYDYSCTIEIRCDTILNNMGNLTSGKEGYVPKNGTILRTTTVGFNDGETVFDVLKRICDSKGIQIEFSYTPMYGSNYVEGINHLYEFDCGSQSGWMYKVNGWFPNYGSSSYKLKDGDVIVWCYTCNGLGEDVGGGVY